MSNHSVKLTDDYVWLGDLSGYSIDSNDDGRVTVRHRCGWSITSLNYLANIVQTSQTGHDCREFTEY